MVYDLVQLSDGKPDTFFANLADELKTKRRNHIARTVSEIYPDRPDLTNDVRVLIPGWYLGANISNKQKLVFLKIACGLCGLKPIIAI